MSQKVQLVPLCLLFSLYKSNGLIISFDWIFFREELMEELVPTGDGRFRRKAIFGDEGENELSDDDVSLWFVFSSGFVFEVTLYVY